jgi:glyoxylase-like metal-dependent hydrolase (beta-lactamase superfamily II)
VDLLGGKLTILYLNGFLPNLVPLLFGELFTAIIYDGVIVDPGSPKMRRSLSQHLQRIPAGKIESIVATHAHEEHIGNLNWLAKKTGAPIYVSGRMRGWVSEASRTIVPSKHVNSGRDSVNPVLRFHATIISPFKAGASCWVQSSTTISLS